MRIFYSIKTIITLLILIFISCNDTETKYYYFNEGQVSYTREMKNGEVQGKCLEFYRSGEIKFETEIENAKGHGKEFYKNGKLFSEGSYIVVKWSDFEGESLKKVGKHLYYYESGELNAIINYVNEISHNSTLNGEYTIFYKNRNIYHQSNYIRGYMDGRSILCNSRGDIAIERVYKNGEIIQNNEYLEMPKASNNIQFPDLDTYYSKNKKK